MLTRTQNFFTVLDTPPPAQQAIIMAATRYAQDSRGMMHEKDYIALGALMFRYAPEKMFEIGSFLGLTSDFCLSLLPELQVVSIAYINSGDVAKRYNNSNLKAGLLGSEVNLKRRGRYTQLIGDSHQLCAADIKTRFGIFNFVLIDGDHSADGVRADTDLAVDLLEHGGIICWHDANPKPKYQAVRDFLEKSDLFTAIATADTYVGGIAFWHCRRCAPNRLCERTEGVQ